MNDRMTSLLPRSFAAFALIGAVLVACSSPTGDEETTAESGAPLVARLAAAASSDADTRERIQDLRDAGWKVPAWAEARLERIAAERLRTAGVDARGELQRVALTIEHTSGARAEAVFTDQGGDDEAKLALRPLDDAARTLLTSPTLAPVDDPVEQLAEGDVAVDTLPTAGGSCRRHGYTCGSGQGACCNGTGLSCVQGDCWRHAHCTYVEKRSFHIVCFADDNPLGAAYHVRTRKGWDQHWSLYSTYRGCGITCPGIQTWTSHSVVCGEPTGSCTGL